MAKEKVTFYCFLSGVRSFLSNLLKDPIKATPNKMLKDNDFNKTRLINVLLKRDVLERHENIKDSSNSDEKEPKYIVKYKVRKKDFEKRILRIYQRYIEKNTPKKKLNECDGGCGGDVCMSDSNGDTSTTNTGNYTYNVPLFGKQPLRRKIGVNYKKKKEKNEGMGKRSIIITEDQFKYIQENINEINFADIELLREEGECAGDGGGATSTTNTGNYTYDVPFGAVNKNDPTLKRGKCEGGSCSIEVKK